VELGAAAGRARGVCHCHTGIAHLVKSTMQFDYTTLGHVTVDVLEDGSHRPGGAAFYSALQAARLGQRTLILTQGVPSEIEAMLEPYREELELRVLPASHTTTLLTTGTGSSRSQRVLAWAGPLPEDLRLETAILHLAPIARESPTRWHGDCAFVGLTPQGLVRQWRAGESQVSLARAPHSAVRLAASCQALVVSEHEHDSCAELIAAASAAGAVIAVTAGAHPNTILAPHCAPVELEVPRLPRPADDLGAGDVFAAAFFVALADGAAPLAAAGFANAAAAVRMTATGAGAIGRREEIEARLHATGASPRVL
jgi:sugar/nucleoside kinase (ribokinase family)